MPRSLSVVCFVLAAAPAFAQQLGDNSNLWPVHRNTELGFRISYPPDWLLVPTRGVNVRFSANPPFGPGNCNVVARASAELRAISQADLDREVEALPDDQSSWAGYVGLPVSQVVLIESRRARIIQIPALVGTIETSLENLEGKFVRKAVVALTLRPGMIWTLNCGATSFKAEEARSRFAALQSTFSKIFGSFAFLQ